VRRPLTTVVLAVVGLALGVPGAEAGTDPGTVDLSGGTLNYVARAGQANDAAGQTVVLPARKLVLRR